MSPGGRKPLTLPLKPSRLAAPGAVGFILLVEPMTAIAVRTVSNELTPSTGAKASGSVRAACERRALICTAVTVLRALGVGAPVNVAAVESEGARAMSPPAALVAV